MLANETGVLGLTGTSPPDLNARAEIAATLQPEQAAGPGVAAGPEALVQFHIRQGDDEAFGEVVTVESLEQFRSQLQTNVPGKTALGVWASVDVV
jgi:hypothetical protein